MSCVCGAQCIAYSTSLSALYNIMSSIIKYVRFKNKNEILESIVSLNYVCFFDNSLMLHADFHNAKHNAFILASSFCFLAS